MEPRRNDRRERKDARRNQEQVINAARELFARHGADVRIEEVARRAGVGVATVYRCFASKEQLIAAISHDACTMAQQCLYEAAQHAGDARVRLQALIMVQYRSNAQQAALLELASAADGDQQALAVDPSPLIEALRDLLRQIIADGQQQGLFRAGDPAVLAALCVELLHPRTFTSLRHTLATTPEQLAQHTTALLLHGLL
ncbi:MAG TPA: helix-turn-helix domain-containing protein [Roseiflexaceae bacterium]|nr:helix-turn-helix domain-containing protein [Roseiflexaceae bacterium]HMP40492.1 helix-turn-helix domain-containing protein [Roseiflexaceae bacterium]